MNKKLMTALLAASTKAVFIACDNVSTTTETKDTTTAMNVDSSNEEAKMDEGMMTPINAMMDEMKSMQMTGDFDNWHRCTRNKTFKKIIPRGKRNTFAW